MATRSEKAKSKKRTVGKRRSTVKRKKRRTQDASGGHDRASSRKFHRGGRVEAYTMGEAMGSRGWP